MKIRERAHSTMFCAVVKSDAYGHGIVGVAETIYNYVDCFAVGNIGEGVKLRLAGIDKPIICLIPTNELYRAAYYSIDVVCADMEHFRQMLCRCAQMQICLNVHIAVNSGMNRLGIDSLEQLDHILEKCAAQQWIKPVGIFSHFFNCLDGVATSLQFERFMPFYRLAKAYDNSILGHISSSGSFLTSEYFNLDMVRIGLLMYGYKPFNVRFSVEPVMKICGGKILERHLFAGESVLYGNFKKEDSGAVDIINYGYGGGIRFGLNGQLNNACMNMCAVESGTQIIFDNAHKTAEVSGTTVYDVLCRVGYGLDKIYIN